MSGILDALIDRETDRLLLTRETTEAWPFIQRLFAEDGYFPSGLTILSPKHVSFSAGGETVVGKTLIESVSFGVVIKTSGEGQSADLELTLIVTLVNLTGDGSPLQATWQPKITFKSDRGIRRIELDGSLGTLHLGSLELAASIEMSNPEIATRRTLDSRSPTGGAGLYLRTPGPRLVATLRPGNQRLSAVTSLYGLEAVGDKVEVEELRLSADPWLGVYSIDLATGGCWEIVRGCELKGITAFLLYASEDSDVVASLSASLTLAGVPLRVAATYDARVSGWQFEGGVIPDEPLQLADFVGSLLKQFGADGECPASLSGATLNELFASFNTATGAISVSCEASLPLRKDEALGITLTIDVEEGRKSFRGAVTLGSLEFDLVFDEEDGVRTLVASFSAAEPEKVTLGEIIAMVLNETDEEIIRLGNQASFSIKDALFAYESRGESPGVWLLAADVEAGVDFSGLPLVGSSFPAGQGARLLLQPLFTSGGLDSTALGDRVHGRGLRLPSPVPTEKGFSLTSRVALAAEEIKFGLPVRMSDGKMDHAPGVSPEPAPPDVAHVDDVNWIAVQKAFGPLAMERVGIRYDSGALDFLLDASLSAAGLTLALQGFGAKVKLADPSQFTPTLDGIALDFRAPSIEIAGSLLALKVGAGAEAFEEYVGTALIKAGALTIDAIGSYRIVDGHPSLFVYAALDYPIGGPAFFFVTGLAAAFGYNRSFRLPPIEKLAGFPLLADRDGKGDFRSAGALSAARAALQEYIPPELGAVFLGVGVKFTTFQTVSSSALLTASFGREVALDLIGRSTLIMPAGATREQAVAVIDMAWLASYRPEDGLLALRSELSPGSYVFSHDCHLTGGFAFYSWFSGEHSGEFVLTAGGYHPAFNLEDRPHFPKVPRLGLAWQVNSALSIKGDAYYALTSSAAMVGGHLEMLWDQHPYKVWCKAGIDCMFEWKPLHYTGEAYVELGASYTFEFAGTRHITVEVGADLTVWGPPFSGRARVDLALFSFDVAFGSASSEPPPVHLFSDDGNGVGRGFSALLPAEDKLCAVSVTGGLSRFDDVRKLWVVNPQELRLVVDTVIPSKRIHVEAMLCDENHPMEDTQLQFGIAPMAVGHDGVTSETTITVTKITQKGDRDPVWRPKELRYRLRKKGFPSALWGEPKELKKAPARGKAAEEGLVEALAGVEIVPSGKVQTGAQVDWGGTRLFERHQPFLREGTYDITVTQRLQARSAATAHDAVCCKALEPKASLRFEVAPEHGSLPASCIHSVFPPKGSLGDHTRSLPQVILERSTLPWECAADPAQVTGADTDTPWLALLVFDGERKATAEASRDGAPGSAKITVDASEIPSARALKLLCHVRDADGAARAVVVANRTPSVGKLSTAHLVSLRGIEAVGAQRRLVSLWSWSFSCPAGGAGFETLARDVAKAHRPVPRGCVALGYALPTGEYAVADYRGPLAPLPPVGDGGLSPFDAPSERPDISQRAALELGRLLALENQAVAVGLLRLKRSLAHAARHADQIKAAEHVYPPRPPESPSVAAKAGRLLPVGLQQLLTPELADWAEGLLKLEGLPFRYLLPDESQLPKESIRSFAVDERWMTNLLLGALGVGGAWKLGDLAGDLPPGCEAALRVENGPVGEGERPFGTFPVLTGVVLRSQIVSGWPAMTIDACRNAERLVSRRLSPNILLVLFRGVIDEVHFRLPQETLHFDLAQAEPVPAAWLKDATTLEQLRSHAGLSTQEEVRFTL